MNLWRKKFAPLILTAFLLLILLTAAGCQRGSSTDDTGKGSVENSQPVDDGNASGQQSDKGQSDTAQADGSHSVDGGVQAVPNNSSGASSSGENDSQTTGSGDTQTPEGNTDSPAADSAGRSDSEADTTPEADTPDTSPALSLPASSTSILAAGVVNDTALRLRTGPGTDYSIITELGSGTVVSILGGESGWYKVNYNKQTGYMSADYITVHASANGLSGYAVVTTDALNVRASATTSSSVVMVVNNGDCLTVTGFENGWYKISYEGRSGYVSGDYVTPSASKPASSSGSTSSGSSSLPSGGNAGTGSGTGAEVAAYAQTFLGVPYVYGGASPSGFDCSGFIMYIYGQFGCSLPHGTNGQLGYGTPVDRSALQPGDIVFFCDPDYAAGGATSHAGIYIGGGDFIHASTNTYPTGREEVQIHNLNTNAYYNRVYVAARRLIG